MNNSHYKVLIADDVEGNLQLIGSILTKYNIAVSFAKDGKQAVKAAIKKQPHLILMDVNMPEMNGFEACEALKKDERTKEIPVIFLTIIEKKEDIVKGFELGAVDYITKPFHQAELIARVNTHLKLYQQKQDIRVSEAKLNAVINSIPDLIFYKNLEGKYTGCNSAFADFLGMTSTEIIGKSDHDIYEKKEAEIFIISDKKIIETHKPFMYGEWVKNIEGNNIFLDTLKALMVDQGGNGFGIVGISRDITDIKKAETEIVEKNEELESISNELRDNNLQLIESQKKIEEQYVKLKENEEKLSNVLENANEAIFVIQDGDFVFFNTKLCEMLDSNSQEIKENDFVSFVVDEDKEQAYDYYQRKVKGEKFGTSKELRIYGKGREVRHVKINGKLIHWKQRKAVLVLMDDITKQRRTQLELEKYKNHLEELVEERTNELMISRDMFKNIFNSSSDPIIITGLKGEILTYNNATLSCFGLPDLKADDELANLKEINWEGGKATLNKYFDNVETAGEQVFSTSCVNSLSEKKYLELNGKLIKHNNEDAVLHILRDTTIRYEEEKARLNLIIQTEENERKRFAKDIHDGLGATLSAAKMYLNIVKRAEPGTEKAMNMLDKSISLIDDAGKEAKQIAVNIRPHDLSHFGLVVSIQNFCKKLNALGAVKVDFFTNDYDIRLDKVVELNIYRSINELINNTFKYAEAKKISIDILKEDDNLTIIYIDDGKGFDLEKTMNSTSSGTGLSNIVHRAKLIGGYAEINSQPGEGTKVVINIEN